MLSEINMNLSVAPKPLPRGYHAIIDSRFHIDGADYTFGILRKKMDTFFRIAQLGFKVYPDHLEIMNLQGSGPRDKYKRNGLDTKRLYQNLQRAMCGMKPINALVGVLAILAKENPDLQSILYRHNTNCAVCGINYTTVLQAAKFRETVNGVLSLDLSLDERKILQRITGANPERRAYLAGLLDEFREKLEGII